MEVTTITKEEKKEEIINKNADSTATTSTPSIGTATNDMVSEVEEKLGIKTYISNNKDIGFIGIFKSRYSDFIVHEVDNNGKIAKLEATIPVEESESERAEKEAAKQSSEEELEKETISKLIEKTKLSQDEAIKVLNILKNPTKEKNNYVFLLVITKDERRAIHTLIREDPILSKYNAIGDTIDGCVRIWSKEYYTNKKSTNYKRSAQNEKWPRDRPNFAKFILYKENIDTNTACKDICRILNPKNFKSRLTIDTAGMKDKRGMTTQYCTVYRKNEQELLDVNTKFMEKYNKYGGKSNSILKISSIEYVTECLKLGSLYGNRFDIALRNIKPQQSKNTNNIIKIIKDSITSYKTNGFINYFGTQRFGKYHDTYSIGIHVLKHNFQHVINTILNPKTLYKENYENVVSARIKWKQRFDKMNDDDSTQLKDHEGEEDTQEKRKLIEKTLAKEIIVNFGRFMISEVAILSSLMRKPCDYQSAFLSIPRPTKLMFVHAVQSYLWNILATKRATLGHDVIVGDLVLVQDKNKEDGGSGTSGLLGKVVEYVTKQNIHKYNITDVVLPLIGTKVLYPKINETNNSFPALDQLLNELELKSDDFDQKNIRELKLGGDYRKFVVKPLDITYSIKEYSDDNVEPPPLIISDNMKINNDALPCTVRTIDYNEDYDSLSSDSNNKKLALTIGFTLPASSYATIAMRELMKCPTSSDFQILLEEGDDNGVKQDKDEIKEDSQIKKDEVMKDDNVKIEEEDKKRQMEEKIDDKNDGDGAKRMKVEK